MAWLDVSIAGAAGQFRHALHRLDEGSYGICETCHGRIEPRRLMAQPQATECLVCAERRAQPWF